MSVEMTEGLLPKYTASKFKIWLAGGSFVSALATVSLEAYDNADSIEDKLSVNPPAVKRTIFLAV